MESDHFTPDLRQLLFTALTGRSGDVRVSGSLTDRLAAAFGPGYRGAVVNTAAAAAALGVTRRTVQRWVSGQIRNPNPVHLREVNTRARQAASTQAGRRAALAAARGDRAERYGATLRVQGLQGVKDYERFRWFNLDLGPDRVQAMRDAYEAGGDKGLLAWTTTEADQNYVDNWNILTIERWDFDPR